MRVWLEARWKRCCEAVRRALRNRRLRQARGTARSPGPCRAAASHDGPPATGRTQRPMSILRSPAQERMSRSRPRHRVSAAAATAVDAEINLQPIMSVSHGTTPASTSSDRSGRRASVHLRDIAEPPAGFDAAAFDAQTVAAAVAVARRGWATCRTGAACGAVGSLPESLSESTGFSPWRDIH